MALPTLSSLSLQVAVKNWLLYDVSHLDVVPPMFLEEILHLISPWQLYRSSGIFKTLGFDTASAWTRFCSGSQLSYNMPPASKIHANHSILYNLRENWVSVDDVLRALAEECLENGFHELIHIKDLDSTLCTSSRRAKTVTGVALMSANDPPTLFCWSLLGMPTEEQLMPQLVDFLKLFNLRSPRKLEIRAKRFHRAAFYWLPFIGPSLEDIDMSFWKSKYATDGVRLLDALMSYGVLKSVRVSLCILELRDWFRFLSVAIGHSVHCLDDFHAVDDDGSFDDVSPEEPEYVWHSRPQLYVSKPALPGLTCVCGPKMRHGLTSFAMDCHIEHKFLALHLILPHWYNLQELELEDCGDCPWLLARIARQTAAPYKLSKIRLLFERSVNSTKLFHLLTSELGKYVSEQNSIQELDVRFLDTVDSSDGDNLFSAPCIVYCENLRVENPFSDRLFRMQTLTQICLNTSLKRLHLTRHPRNQDGNICDLVISALLNINDCPLEELSMQRMRIGVPILRMLMLSLPKMRHIHSLDLSRSIEEKALDLFSNGEFVAALRQVPSLRVLKLELIALGMHAVVLLTSLINADGSRATQLQVLKLRNNGIRIAPLMQAISMMHRMRQGRGEKLLDVLELGSLDICKAGEERFRLASEQLASLVNQSDFMLEQGIWSTCESCGKLPVNHFNTQ